MPVMCRPWLTRCRTPSPGSRCAPPPPSTRGPASGRSMRPPGVRCGTTRGVSPSGSPTRWSSLPPSPTPEDVLRRLHEDGLPRARTPCQGDLASACSASRPVVERIRASLRCRGAARVTDTGHRGAIVHTGMAIMAHHVATVVRIHASRLSKRARTFRRRLRLRCRQVTHCKASINEWSLCIRLQVSENHALRYPLSLPFGPRPAVAVPGKTEAFQISGTTELNKPVFLGNDSDTATIDRRGGESHGAGQGGNG